MWSSTTTKKSYFVYILSNYSNQVLYIGVTNNLKKRVYEHRQQKEDTFAGKYKTEKLVYYECTEDIFSAIRREKQLKHWRREKKEKLIMQTNPFWEDLYEKL